MGALEEISPDWSSMNLSTGDDYDTFTVGPYAAAGPIDTSPCDSPPKQDDIGYLLFYTVLGALFLLGIIGNSTLVFIIARYKEMRTVPNTYILHLSLASLLITISSALSPFLDNDIFVQPFVCASVQAVREVSICASVYLLVVLSFERYHAIAYPVSHNTGIYTRPANTVIAIVVVWALSVTLTTVKFVFAQIKCTKSGTQFYRKVVEQNVAVGEFAFVYLFPLLIIASLYILMAQEIYLGTRLPEECDKKTEMEIRLYVIKRRFVWVVLALVVTFAISFVPFHVMRLVLIFNCDKTGFLVKLKRILLYFTNIYHCASPAILYIFSEPCRRHLKHFLLNIFSSSSAIIPSTVQEDNRSRVNSRALLVVANTKV